MTPHLEFRRARASDAPDMVRITKDVWGGNDYVPFVWNQWLADESGIVMVAVLEGELAALQHIDFQPDNTAWFEGIRVDPDLHGQGVGQALLDRGISWVRDLGLTTVRLSTSSDNPSSNRIAEKAGLTRVGRFAPVHAPPGEEAAPCTVRVAAPAETEDLWRWLQGRGHEYYTEGWTAYQLTPDRLRLLLATNSIAVYWPDEISAVAVATVTVRRSAARVGLIDGESAGVEVMGRWLRAVAARSGLHSVRGPVRASNDVLDALTRAGFESEHEFTMLLHELILDNTGTR